MAQFPPESVAALTQQLRDVGYLADRGLDAATQQKILVDNPARLFAAGLGGQA